MKYQKASQFPNICLKYYQKFACPKQKNELKEFLSSVVIFESQNIENIVQNFTKQFYVFTTGKTFAWRVEVVQNKQNNKLARSKTSDQFVIHTDHSFAKNPPEFVALYCQKQDKLQGGKSRLISLDQVLFSLSSEQIQGLLNIKFPFRVPEQFIQFNNNQQINYLPILYKQDEEILIRWRGDIIIRELLSSQQIQLLDKITQAIESVTPFQFNLHQKQCFIINNAKFLHARTQIKDKNRLLYRVMFGLNPQIKGQVKTQMNFNSQIYSEELQKYRQTFAQEVNQKDCLAISPDFFTLQTFKLDSSFGKIQKLKTSLNRFYKTIVKLYSQQNQIGKQLRKMLNWPQQVNNLIEQMNQKIPYDIGFYRPDFILEQVQKNVFSPKICEVNARYALNGFIISFQLQKLSFPNESKLKSPKIIQEIVMKKFNNAKTIHFITNSQKAWDPLLLSSMIKPLGIQIKMVKSTQIKSKIVNQKIQSLEDSNGDQIKCVIFELKQEQFIEFANDQFQKLKFLIFNTITLNDFRSIFITHDKRLLTIFHQKSALYKNLQMNYLFHAEMPILKKFTIPSFIITQQMLTQSSIINFKNDWVIKAPHKGKGVDMVFGQQLTEQSWIQTIKQKTGCIIQKYIQPLKIPIFCPSNQVSQKNCIKKLNTVCTFLCYNDEFLEIGFTRASQQKKVALSCNGVALVTLIQNSSKKQSKFDYYDKIKNVKIYSSQQIQKLCELKYEKKILRMSKLDLLQFNQSLEIQKSQSPWHSSYVSPSGGSSNNFCYIRNNIDQNHFLRKILGQEFEQNKIIQKTDICIVLQTSMVVYRARQIFTEFCELAGATAIPLDHEVNNQTVFHFINYFSSNVFISSPSRLISFAKFMEKKSTILTQINKIIYGGELLYDNQRTLVNKIFPFATLCSVYGSAESGVWAYTRKGFEANHIFNYPSNIFQLFIQEPNQNGVGKLLVTSLIRTKTPIYKFQMGEYARIINSNTFQLIPKPSVLKFKLLYVDFDVQEWLQLLKTLQKWQILLQNIPQPKITFKIKVSNLDKDQFACCKSRILQYLICRFKQDSGIQNEFAYNNLVKSFQNVQQDRQFIRCMPSNKHYYIVDRRLCQNVEM